MTPLLENAELVTDLDCNWFDLLNVGGIIPVPGGLVTTDDPRLTDARNPKPGSVVDGSVAATAAILQSKLNLNGLIPTAWLGSTSTTAARGDLSEYLARKAQPNGYASLDGTGKVPVAQLPVGAGAGTITSIGLTMPAQFLVTGSPVTVTGTLAVAWANVPAVSWLGNASGSPAVPVFSSAALPVSLIPGLPTNKIVSGVFTPDKLPPAVGVGGSHSAGAAPDPGATGSPFDYLARDMTYRPIPVFGPGYQPQVPDPVVSITGTISPYSVSVTETLDGAALFYSIDNPNGGFQPVPDTGSFNLYASHVAYVYAAMTGYTNSNVISIAAPTAPPGELVTDQLGAPITGDDSLNVTVGP